MSSRDAGLTLGGAAEVKKLSDAIALAIGVADDS
jgi:hypothetical protein